MKEMNVDVCGADCDSLACAGQCTDAHVCVPKAK